MKWAPYAMESETIVIAQQMSARGTQADFHQNHGWLFSPATGITITAVLSLRFSSSLESESRDKGIRKKGAKIEILIYGQASSICWYRAVCAPHLRAREREMDSG